MVEKRRGLSKGLDFLLSTVKTDTVAAEQAAQNSELQYLAIDVLQRGKYQPRRDIAPETLKELADSITAQGVLQPIVVRKVSEKQYEIIAGERRWRAAKLAGLTQLPAIIRDVPDEAAIAMALIENIQRENLNPLEEAHALQRLLEEFRLSHQQVANSVGKSRTTVTNLLRLMQLHQDVQQLLLRGEIDMGHAKAILALDTHHQPKAAQQVVERQLSVRETERLIRKFSNKEPAEIENKPLVSAEIKQVEKQLSQQLGMSVSIKHNANGKGKLVIRYSDLEKIQAMLNNIK